MVDREQARKAELSQGSSDLDSLKRQQSIVAVLNLSMLATASVVHIAFTAHFGKPSQIVLVLFALAFTVRLVQFVWIRSPGVTLRPKTVMALTVASISLNMVLAFWAASLVDEADHPYFALLAPAVIEAAFRLSLAWTGMVIAGTALLNFSWLIHYAANHPSVDESEYFEAGTTTMIYALVGVLVWLLVNELRRKQAGLRENLLKLGEARERLAQEERLAAVGRLSSSIAHEIRNPVAMISSSMAMAVRADIGPRQREEMLEIAAKEAARLAELTNDFLAYARPRAPEKRLNSIPDTLAYVSDICRAHAQARRVALETSAPAELLADFDPASLQQALMNLVINAIDAAPPGSRVQLQAGQEPGQILVSVENLGAPLSADAVAHIFEPFFTTKPRGTGLGLAIARNIAKGHGGDLWLSRNTPDCIRFTLSLPAPAEALAKEMIA